MRAHFYFLHETVKILGPMHGCVLHFYYCYVEHTFCVNMVSYVERKITLYKYVYPRNAMTALYTTISKKMQQKFKTKVITKQKWISRM